MSLGVYDGDMTTVAELRAETRATARARLRDLALDAARAAAIERGWSAVRISEVAAVIGTSRQTLHTEFGTKDNLGQALISREATLFVGGVAQRLAAHPGDLGAAAYDAARFALLAAATNPLLQTALSSADGDDGTLLPSLTTRSEPLISRGVELVSAWFISQWPDTNSNDVRTMAESLVRLVISHAIAPTATPEVAAGDIALAACRWYGLPEPSLLRPAAD